MLFIGYVELEVIKYVIYKNIVNIIIVKLWDNFELMMVINFLIENSFLCVN